MSQNHLIGLKCSETGDINYIVRKKKKAEKPEKLEIKKYSPKLRKHTLHKEIKMKGFK